MCLNRNSHLAAKISSATLAPVLLLGLASLALPAWFWVAPGAEQRVASYGTSLRGRTWSQRYNAQLACRSLDGVVIQPGAIFSFNKTIKSWSLDDGYVKAPVSYGGELVRAYGGGVCQTSTTFYNAALLAGMTALERHPHTFAAHYCPPGRDAAVAQYTIDLRFKNPYTWPLKVKSQIRGDELLVSLFAPQAPSEHAEISTEVLSTEFPARLTLTAHGSKESGGMSYLRSPGAVGYRVVTWRSFYRQGKETRRERLSDDSYDAMNRVVAFIDEK